MAPGSNQNFSSFFSLGAPKMTRARAGVRPKLWATRTCMAKAGVPRSSPLYVSTYLPNTQAVPFLSGCSISYHTAPSTAVSPTMTKRSRSFNRPVMFESVLVSGACRSRTFSPVQIPNVGYSSPPSAPAARTRAAARAHKNRFVSIA